MKDEKDLVLIELDSDFFYFLFVGELSEEKGVDTLLEAFSGLKNRNIKLLLVGEGKFFRSTSDPRIEFLGKLPNEIVIQYMRSVNCFLFPSRFEGMPNVIKEAGIVGLPIIGSCAGGIPELLNEGERGYLLPEVTVKAIINSVTYALNSENEMKTKAAKLKSYLIDNYDIKNTSVQLEKVYRSIIFKQN